VELSANVLEVQPAASLFMTLTVCVTAVLETAVELEGVKVTVGCAGVHGGAVTLTLAVPVAE